MVYKTMKRCPACKQVKSRDDFQIATYKADGLFTYCRDCANARNQERRNAQARRVKKLADNYSISEAEYQHMLQSQHGVCAICKEPETKKGRNGETRLLCVDHDHVTGAVRALLCLRCNIIINYFEVSAERMKSAGEYLKRAADMRRIHQLKLF